MKVGELCWAEQNLVRGGRRHCEARRAEELPACNWDDSCEFTSLMSIRQKYSLW